MRCQREPHASELRTLPEAAEAGPTTAQLVPELTLRCPGELTNACFYHTKCECTILNIKVFVLTTYYP